MLKIKNENFFELFANNESKRCNSLMNQELPIQKLVRPNYVTRSTFPCPPQALFAEQRRRVRRGRDVRSPTAGDLDNSPSAQARSR